MCPNLHNYKSLFSCCSINLFCLDSTNIGNWLQWFRIASIQSQNQHITLKPMLCTTIIHFGDSRLVLGIWNLHKRESRSIFCVSDIQMWALLVKEASLVMWGTIECCLLSSFLLFKIWHINFISLLLSYMLWVCNLHILKTKPNHTKFLQVCCFFLFLFCFAAKVNLPFYTTYIAVGLVVLVAAGIATFCFCRYYKERKL